MKLFEEYLNAIVGRLNCSKSEKEELKAEFLDHLNALKEEYMGKGFNENDAVIRAIEDFGEIGIVGDQLNRSIGFTGKIFKRICKASWLSYILIVVWKLIIGGNRMMFRQMSFYENSADVWLNVNLIPFKQIGEYILNYNRYNFDIWFSNLFGNMIIFMPFGFLLPFIHGKGKSLKSNILFAFLFSLFIEGMQYVFGLGIFDIDDIILNIAGSVIGFYAYKLFSCVLKLNQKTYLIDE